LVFGIGTKLHQSHINVFEVFFCADRHTHTQEENNTCFAQQS